MSKIVAGITTSVDGYVTGPDDGPGRGLGVGGERLHYWVFGGPWSYESARRGEASGEDKAYLDEMTGANGAVIAGRSTYEAAGHWGGSNPWDVPLFIVTHHGCHIHVAGTAWMWHPRLTIWCGRFQSDQSPFPRPACCQTAATN